MGLEKLRFAGIGMQLDKPREVRVVEVLGEAFVIWRCRTEGNDRTDYEGFEVAQRSDCFGDFLRIGAKKQAITPTAFIAKYGPLGIFPHLLDFRIGAKIKALAASVEGRQEFIAREQSALYSDWSAGYLMYAEPLSFYGDLSIQVGNILRDTKSIGSLNVDKDVIDERDTRVQRREEALSIANRLISSIVLAPQMAHQTNASNGLAEYYPVPVLGFPAHLQEKWDNLWLADQGELPDDISNYFDPSHWLMRYAAEHGIETAMALLPKNEPQLGQFNYAYREIEFDTGYGPRPSRLFNYLMLHLQSELASNEKYVICSNPECRRPFAYLRAKSYYEKISRGEKAELPCCSDDCRAYQNRMNQANFRRTHLAKPPANPPA